MISYSEALSIINEEFRKVIPSAEQVPLLQSAGRILSEDIKSDIDLPSFNNSAMDGYAVAFSPSIRQWNIEGIIPAGHFRQFAAGNSSAAEIMTGAQLPGCFDTVIPLEDAEVDAKTVSLKKGAQYKKGMNVRLRGNDIRSGELLLKENTFITSKEIAVMASAGKTSVNVYRKLKTGILTTGDELVDISEYPSGDKIRASNLYGIIAAAGELNFEPENLGIIKDETEHISEKIDSALSSDIDILITTGGVSAGRYDLLKEIFIQSGAEIKFHKVNIKPGKPVLFAAIQRGGKVKLIFGLPGNPVSAIVGFLIFIKKAFNIRFGERPFPQIPAVLGSDVKKQDTKMHFLGGKLEQTSDVITAYPFSSQSSGNAASFSKADCLIIINEEQKDPRKGDPVKCIMI